jgi:cell division protease FtsH
VKLGYPSLKVSGSQFVELLVGVEASRVREFFEKARSLKPSIIFIDEIDSIAKARSGNNRMGGGNDDPQNPKTPFRSDSVWPVYL